MKGGCIKRNSNQKQTLNTDQALLHFSLDSSFRQEVESKDEAMRFPYFNDGQMKLSVLCITKVGKIILEKTKVVK